MKKTENVWQVLPLVAIIFVGCAGGSDKTPKQSGAELTAKGKQLYTTVCVACHGTNAEGNKALNSPALAGQEDWYLARQMRHFKSGVRGADPNYVPGTQMAAIAKTLTDADIPALATYISLLPQHSHSATIDGNAQSGKDQYQTVCTACHGNMAQGNKPLNAPRLTGLQDWYLAAQMAQFTDGARGTHPQDTFGLQMRPMAATVVGEAARNDVANYLITLH